VAERQTPTA